MSLTGRSDRYRCELVKLLHVSIMCQMMPFCAQAAPAVNVVGIGCFAWPELIYHFNRDILG